tara:strand:- start:6311 stop:6865 length:555 start_codon:yes stop_codon:yes gene_type:complete
MVKQIIEKIKPELEKSIEFLKRELAKIRTGQASPALVEDIMVEAFSQQLPLKQLAGISCPERRQILIQPWDVSHLSNIEKALQKSSLGVSPIIEENKVRVVLPQLTKEYRQTLGRLLAEKAEQAKQTLRKWREEAWSEIQEQAREGQISEDDKFKGKDELQKLLDEYGSKVEDIAEKKKKEIEL